MHLSPLPLNISRPFSPIHLDPSLVVAPITPVAPTTAPITNFSLYGILLSLFIFIRRNYFNINAETFQFDTAQCLNPSIIRKIKFR